MDLSNKNKSIIPGVLLVGHGASAKDCPRDLIMRLKALEGQRQRVGGEPSSEETGLDRQIRQWPRTPQNDPYKTGLETLAGALRPHLNGSELAVAYNEFCAPSVEEAAEGLIGLGIDAITVIPTMMTPGGVHSEIEIPRILDHLRARHPNVSFRYIWPFDLARVAQMLSEHLKYHGKIATGK